MKTILYRRFASVRKHPFVLARRPQAIVSRCWMVFATASSFFFIGDRVFRLEEPSHYPGSVSLAFLIVVCAYLLQTFIFLRNVYYAGEYQTTEHNPSRLRRVVSTLIAVKYVYLPGKYAALLLVPVLIIASYFDCTNLIVAIGIIGWVCFDLLESPQRAGISAFDVWLITKGGLVAAFVYHLLLSSLVAVATLCISSDEPVGAILFTVLMGMIVLSMYIGMWPWLKRIRFI